MVSLRWAPVVLVILVMSSMVSAAPSVVINEIMYNPADNHSDYSGEWLELYNPNDFPVNLSGWSIEYDGHVEFTFRGSAVIPEGGYIVVSRNTTWFQETYGKGTLGDDLFGNLSSYRFSNTGTHWIALLESNGETVDNVTYSDGCPENYSLEKKDPTGSSNATGDNWACSQVDGGTPLEKNSVYVPFFGSIIAGLSVFALVFLLFHRR
ncbi:lamin tail domain-containing protein [Thermococcus sp.]|uniref:lamin tail domain-containing protein n=1 Tax=Thermococcus sp. TaxID=35749 RepID=UPI002627FE64|nr:lamin tail domain-containing protein [Thermococcus sp.]